MIEPGNLLEVRHPYWVDGEGSGLWPFNKHTNAYALALVVKTGPGKLYGFTVYNSGAAQFVQVHDCTTVPASGAIPAAVFAAGATANLGVYFGDTGRSFNAGCVIVNSSTGPTYTAGSADCFIDAQYLQAVAFVSTMVTPPLAESDVTGLTTDLAAKTVKATLTTKGDIYAASAASTPARVAVGAAGTALVASSGAASGVAYGGVQVTAGVPTGAPTGLPFAYDTTAVTGGFYFWNGAAWVEVAAILQMTLTGDTLDFVQGGIVTSSAQIVDNGATTGDVLTVQADKSIAAAPGGGSQAGVMARAIRTFTETAGAGIYTATVVVPQYAMVYTVGLVIVDGPWDADSVSLDAGDTQDPKGYWDGYDFNSVSVYDPSTANIDASSGAAAPGFDGGNYFSGGPTNGDLWGGGVSQNGNAPVYYHAAGDTITLALTTTGAGGTTGRLHAVVVGTDVPAGIAAAVKAQARESSYAAAADNREV